MNGAMNQQFHTMQICQYIHVRFDKAQNLQKMACTVSPDDLDVFSWCHRRYAPVDAVGMCAFKRFH
jgi:hypothetical protein